jgi:uncharacterized membrane-anchored protein
MKIFPFLFLFLFSAVGFAQDSSSTQTLRILSYQKSGTARLGTGLAEIKIPAGYKFLDAEQSNYVLTTLWGNPPSETFGMLFPDYASDTIPTTWAIEMSYSDEGHIDDGDAEDIDYDELLTGLQEGAAEETEQRKKEGYATYKLLGWASKPYYDSKNKKLHWAKRLKFDTDSSETLNYNIRILGKEGVLVLNAIGSPSDLDEINKDLPGILPSVNFVSGNTYADYKEGVDKKASYGIAGLIAGGILMKTGLLAKLGIFFAKFAKLIIVGLIAAFGGLWKWFKGRNSSPEASVEDKNTPNEEAPNA